MAEKTRCSEVCQNGAVDAQRKKAAANFLVMSLEKKISGGHVPRVTASPPPLPSTSYLPQANGKPRPVSNGSPPSFTASENAAHPGPVVLPKAPPTPSVYYSPMPRPHSSGSLSSSSHPFTKSESAADRGPVVRPKAPSQPSVYYPPKPPPRSNTPPASSPKSDNTARRGTVTVTVSTRVSPLPRPSPPRPTAKLRSDDSWRKEPTQSEHRSRRQHEGTHESRLTRSERLPLRPAPPSSETKPKPPEIVVSSNSKSELLPPAPCNDAQPPLQPNGTIPPLSNGSTPSLTDAMPQPSANGSVKAFPKSVRIEEATDGGFFSRHVSPFQRRRSRSLSSTDGTRKPMGRSSSLARTPLHSTREAVKSPGKKRRFGIFRRSSNNHQESSKASPKSSKLSVTKTAPVKAAGEDSSEDFRENLKKLRRVPDMHSGIHRSESPRLERHSHSDEYPELFEYLLIIEAGKNLSTGKLEPKITYRFPQEDDHYLAKRDEVLAEIPRFCFPDIEHLRNVKKSERYSFVLTDIKGDRKFGYCRRIRSPQKHAISPEVFCIVSPLGCFQLFETILDEIEHRRKCSRNAVYTFLKALIANPFPAPGKSVSVKVFSPKGKGQLEQETLTFTRPVDSRLEHVDFGELFTFTSVKKVLYIVASLMFERRVILTSKKLSSLTSCCHALLALIYPIMWQHVYIPILPDDLVDMVSSPTPYLVGISPQAAKCLDAQEIGDVLLVDLDTSKRLRKIGDEKTLLPPRIMSFFVDRLEALLAQYPESKRVGSPEFNTQVADIFIRVQVYFLGRTTKYLQEDRGDYTLQHEEFLASFYEDDEREFMKTLLTTQMFDVYLEEIEKALKSGVVLNGHFQQKCTEFGENALEPDQFHHRRKRSYFGKKS